MSAKPLLDSFMIACPVKFSFQALGPFLRGRSHIHSKDTSQLALEKA